MPIPKVVAVFNKYVTNRFTLLFAGRLPPLAVVIHRGRNSGRRYRTPIMAFPTETGFVFALTYGRNVDWVKNLMTSDGGSLESNGDEVPIHGIRFVKYADMKELFPFWFRIPLGIISVEDCIFVEAST
ncbi:MAG: nitroreductase family deazaflavin-dependent oxidoreductase [Candidatus Bathyarchaeota archaeon]|nr:MAG: nitroreductase family deazaflavin-dependent oxidoreductase [Candidatus Bathyarchaeota archaeon]